VTGDLAISFLSCTIFVPAWRASCDDRCSHHHNDLSTVPTDSSCIPTLSGISSWAVPGIKPQSMTSSPRKPSRTMRQSPHWLHDVSTIAHRTTLGALSHHGVWTQAQKSFTPSTMSHEIGGIRLRLPVSHALPRTHKLETLAHPRSEAQPHEQALTWE
jgi:hypothetical protein